MTAKRMVFAGTGVIEGAGVAVWVGVSVSVGVWVGVGVSPVVNSITSLGAAGDSPSKDSAVRRPVPRMRIAIEFPDAQAGRFTISWTMEDIFGDCHFALSIVQDGMSFQATC